MALMIPDYVKRLLNWKQGDEEDNWRNKAVETLIKKLRRQPNEQYSALQLALNRKSEDTPCITLSKSQDGRLQVSHRKMLPHVMYCRIFRWPDLQNHHELRSVPSCQYPASRREATKICVNPYHYTRIDHSIYPPVVTPRSTSEYADATPPPQSPLSPGSNYSSQQQNSPNYYTNCQMMQITPNSNHHTNHQPFLNMNMNDSPPAIHQFDSQSSPPPGYSGPGQIVLPMTGDNNYNNPDEGQDCWCRITYAELNQKIGEPFKSCSPEVIVDGFTDPSVRNRRFSLGVLSNINRNSVIETTRRAIRRGICLENCNDAQIFVKNLSESSIFFHSKNCNVENQLNQHAVVKIEPQGRHKIFDQKVFENLVHEATRSQDGKTYERLFSLIEHCIIKMSFVKGWGSIYQRQDVTSTPCWIEIHLLKPYALIDNYLQQVRPTTCQMTSTS